MSNRLLDALGSKVLIGVAAGTLAAGSVMAATVGVPAVIGGDLIGSESEIEHDDADELGEQLEVFEETIDTPSGDDDHGGDKPHPDNFGARVSEDARDGGVDGQEISDDAHERNEDRREARREAREDDGWHGYGHGHDAESRGADDDADDDDESDESDESDDGDLDDLGDVVDDEDDDEEDDGERPEDRNDDDPGRGHGRGGDGADDDD